MAKILSIIKNIFLSLLLIIFSINVAFATQDTISIGGVAGNIHGGASILARIMWAACVIVGIALFITAFSQFQIHRRNPKLVPLANPITYLILALCSLTIPFAEQIFGFRDANQEDNQYVEPPSYLDIDQ